MELRKRHVSASAGTGISVDASTQVITNTDLGSSAVSSHVGVSDPHSQYIFNIPTTDTRNVIQPSSSTVKALVIKGFASQSNNLLEFQDSSGALFSVIDENGRFGYNVADPTVAIDLAGVAGRIKINTTTTGNNSAINVTSTGRYGIVFNQSTTSGSGGSLLSGNYTTSVAGQGIGLNFNVYSTGTTAPNDYLIGAAFYVFQRRDADMTDIRTIGFSIFSVVDIDASSTINVGDIYGAVYSVGMGFNAGGMGTKTAPNAVGIVAGPVKVGPSDGTLVFTNFASIKSDQDLTWAGAGSFTITNNVGFWATEVDRGTNNTNLLLGDTGTTGNWSIYNASTYDSMLALNAVKTHIRDSGIYLASLDNGHFDITADISVDINAPVLFVRDVLPETDDTYWLGEIGSPFKSYKGVIIKDTTNGKHYKITVISGVVTTTALD